MVSCPFATFADAEQDHRKEKEKLVKPNVGEPNPAEFKKQLEDLYVDAKRDLFKKQHIEGYFVDAPIGDLPKIGQSDEAMMTELLNELGKIHPKPPKGPGHLNNLGNLNNLGVTPESVLSDARSLKPVDYVRIVDLLIERYVPDRLQDDVMLGLVGHFSDDAAVRNRWPALHREARARGIGRKFR